MIAAAPAAPAAGTAAAAVADAMALVEVLVEMGSVVFAA